MKNFLLFKATLCIGILAVACEECTFPSSTFIFNRPEDHVVVIAFANAPESNYSTTCQYVTANSEGHVLGVVISCSAKENTDMAIGKSTADGAVLELHLDGQVKQVPQNFEPNSEVFLCTVVDSIVDTVDVFIDGMKVATLQYDDFPPGPPAGAEIRLGGAKDTNLPGYVGKMRNGMIWNRKLNAKEIQDMYIHNQCPYGASFKISRQNVLPHGIVTPQADCPESEHHLLSNRPNTTEYIEVLRSIPALKSATVCAWITTNSNGMVPGTVGSVVVGEKLDMIASVGVMVAGIPSLKISAQGQSKISFIPLDGNTEHHFCLSMDFFSSEVSAYLDGDFGTKLDFVDLKAIQEGAKIIIGQRQGCLGGCFDSPSAFHGKIRDFIMWDRVLSSEEIKAIALSNKCPTEHVADLTAENILFHRETVAHN